MLILFKSECFSVGHDQDDADEALIEFFLLFYFSQRFAIVRRSFAVPFAIYRMHPVQQKNRFSAR